MSPRAIGLVDGLVFLSFWSFVGITASTYWLGALPVMLLILVPTAALVSWRGAVLATSLQEGQSSLKQHMFDGAKWGSLAGLVFVGWSVVSQVSAAGGHLDGANLFSVQVAIYLLYIGAPLMLAGAVVGSVHGGVYFYLNRWLTTANKSG